jgi:hypothetical protein
MVWIGQQRHHVTDVLWIVVNVIDQDTILLVGTLKSNGGLIVLIKPPALTQTHALLIIKKYPRYPFNNNINALIT